MDAAVGTEEVEVAEFCTVGFFPRWEGGRRSWLHRSSPAKETYGKIAKT
jgi:hypothetical protein